MLQNLIPQYCYIEVSLLRHINMGGSEVQISGGMKGAGISSSLRSKVGERFDANPIPQLSQHCTGWRSAARTHSVLYLEYHHLWGHSGIFPSELCCANFACYSICMLIGDFVISIP